MLSVQSHGYIDSMRFMRHAPCTCHAFPTSVCTHYQWRLLCHVGSSCQEKAHPCSPRAALVRLQSFQHLGPVQACLHQYMSMLIATAAAFCRQILHTHVWTHAGVHRAEVGELPSTLVMSRSYPTFANLGCRCRYGDFGHMFEQLLRTQDSGEIWDVFYPTDDQWPAEGALESYKVQHQSACPDHQYHLGPGRSLTHACCISQWCSLSTLCTSPWSPSCMQGVVVTGSASDSFSDEPWIARLRGEMAAAAGRGQRILGVCFGCQIMALALGGKAGAGLACTWFTHAGCPG